MTRSEPARPTNLADDKAVLEPSQRVRIIPQAKHTEYLNGVVTPVELVQHRGAGAGTIQKRYGVGLSIGDYYLVRHDSPNGQVELAVYHSSEMTQKID